MDFRLLGPLEVRHGGRPVRITGPRQRALLALLLLEADRVVSTARILELLWDEPPASGPKALQMSVSALRRTLSGSRDLLVTTPPGYRLHVPPDDIDVHRFERLVSEAQGVLSEDPARAASLLRDALALWRGPALAEFASERFAASEAARLEALREEALEQRIEVELSLGGAAELIPELEGLVARHPLRERLRGQLMRALYRVGRQADALEVYRTTRATLVDELGIEPGPELQRLEQAILRHELDADTAQASRASAPTPAGPAAASSVEERKLVTALFADLADSTALGERLDPERLRVILAGYFDTMSAVVTRWGGTVEKFIGDAVVAVFGIPTVHEDDAERALSAAMDMRDRLHELNASLRERHGVELALKVGINTGEVLASAATGQFMMTGDVVNSAARLEQTAQPGEILVGERTHRAVRHAFELEDAGELRLKGKAASVQAWRAVGARAANSRREVAPPSRLIGRERELVLLETHFAAAAELQRPQLVAVVGPAGIGKTRLVDEFVTRTSGTVYRGRCLSYGEGITYWALREVVWHAAGILLDDSAQAAAEKLDTLVRALRELTDEERARVRFALAATAGLIGAAEEEAAALSPEAVHEELTLTWPLFVSALAAQEPLILVVEDVHWAEAALLEMLDHLLVRAVGPILIVATSRPEGEELPSLRGRRPGAQQLSLEPLGDRHARELLAALLPDAQDGTGEALLEAAEGNPLFLEELVHHIVDLGTEPEDGLVIPDTLRGLLAARIDALSPEQKVVLQDAAVIGRVFWTTALEAMRGEDPRPSLLALEDRGLVVTRPSSQVAGHAELAFRHALIREVAYQSIPLSRRARAHAAAADWIERLAQDRRDEFVDLIAHHAAAAADPENAELAWPEDPALRESLRAKAVAALVAAGHAARARFGLKEALRLADRATALAGSDRERLGVIELRADVAHAAVRTQEAWSLYLEALAVAGSLGDLQAGARLAASATLLWSRYFGAFPDTEWHGPAAEIVRTWLDRLGESSEAFEVGALLVGRAMLDDVGIQRRPLRAALADTRRALEIAEGLSSQRLLSYAVDAMTMLMATDGLCDAAQAGRLAAEARDRVQDRWTAHEMLIQAAQLRAAGGEAEEARKLAEEAAHEAASLSTHQRIHAAAAQAYALIPLGRLAELRDATAAAPDLVEEEGRRTCYHGLIALSGQLLAAHEIGDEASVRRIKTLIAEVTRSGPDPLGEAVRAIELVLRVVGVETSARRLREHPLPSRRTAAIRHIRTAVQIAALAGDAAAVAKLAPEGRTLAREACAPALGSIADWAEAVVAGEWLAAERAARELPGEAYLSARLLADLVPLVPELERGRLADDAARRLDALGAVTSASEVRGLHVSVP